jgi:arylsulfatase A-like enzyme
MFTDTEMPRSPSFNEADVSDKPGIIRDLLQIEPDEIAQIEETYRKRLRSMLAIDDLVEGIVNTLEETGELNNTYIVYTSDNGYHLGTHRMIAGKTTPYEEDIAVPFVIRGPGVPAGVQIDVLVVNNDLAPSFAAMAGIEPPAFVDGRSFLPLFSEPDQPWRQVFAIERRALENHQLTGAAYYNGLRTADLTYVEYGSGERELYDHASDPYQLGNLAGEAPSDILEALSQRLAQLVQCAGSECRRLEDLPVDHTWTPPAPVAELPVLPAVPLVPEKDEKQLN